jgi:hypothetical protein
MSWWDFGEHTGYHGNELAVHRIKCGFCEEDGNFATAHYDLRKHPKTGKTLNYDTPRCGNCGNLTMVFWSASVTVGMHNFYAFPWPQATTRFPDHWPADVGRYWLQGRI